ncbi:MAG: OmpA family protein [Sterolibacterium sp.]|jgi:outer membrane protein OmpA-like peptidoglycan-associated protein
MKRIPLTPILLAIAALTGACSSMPNSTSLLDQTRGDYQAAQNNPGVANYAPLEMKQTDVAMAQANAAASKSDSADKIDKLAYLAKQKIALTQEVVKQKTAEASVATASKERDQIRLDQRTNEANQANANAEQSKMAAHMALNQAAAAQRKTRDAQDAAADAQRATLEAQTRAAQLEAQLADMAAKQTERGMVITLGDVLFGTDMARLNPEGMRTAQKLADFLQQYPQRTVLVEGFTDSTGTSPHNQELSERRATAVRSTLLELGVSRERIAIRGYGESFPVASNNTAESRQLNRRVEIVLSDVGGKVIQR